MNRVAGVLRLEARGFESLTRWRWVLIDEADGTEIAAHDVRLTATDWQFEAFADLHQYLTWHVAPDRRGVDDARIVSEVGDWIGTQVLGPVADALAQRALQHHVTVRVTVPEDAPELVLRPLELAYVNGRPLAAQDVTLIMQPLPGADSGVDNVPGPRRRLRVLCLFSQPEGGQPLNLRRERQALIMLIRGIAESGKAADVRALQYGVTRELLRDVLADREGWDIIHISSHGAPGELLLETADGKPDRITAVQLANLLTAARKHVRLITVSACWSAADSVADQRRRLGLPVPSQETQPSDTERPPAPVPSAAPSGTLATELANHLICAVLAMRYPVGHDFAIALSGTLYELLIDKGRPLPRAVALTLKHLSDRAFPALSLATTALFGATAIRLSLGAPKRGGASDENVARLEVSGFPPLPERFVGRVAVMARSSAALARNSGIPGVLLYGMPGGGKTACALELAYGHEHAFDHLVWYKAPDDGITIDGALTDFAFVMEQELPGFQMLDALVEETEFTGFLPRLTKLMKERRVLLVIDNAESLISQGGEWRDLRWGQVIGALTAHRGLGRVVLTSRRVPVGLTGLKAEAVDSLSADETLLLARELPHLQALGQDKIPGIDSPIARRLARRALEASQGHPKLLELAEGQAAYPDRLAQLLEAGDQAWREQGGLPTGFFATGETTGSADDYWHVLTAWTRSVADTLSPGERDMFWSLCCLEEEDRSRAFCEPIWPILWARLDRDGQCPNLDEVLVALSTHGLATCLGEGSLYSIHPGVAEAGRAQAGKPFRETVDTLAADLWRMIWSNASGNLEGGTVNTGLLVRAGLAAVPYFMRQQQWTHAATMLEYAFVRDPSWANAVAVLPAIQAITRHEPRQAGVLARVLRVIDPAAAESQLLNAIKDAATDGDYRTASVLTGWLSDAYRSEGRLADALTFSERMADYTRQANLGPWTQLSVEGRQLQVRVIMGQTAEVLTEVYRLHKHMDTLSTEPGPDETADPWSVREGLLDIGNAAAVRLERWNDAIALNAMITTSKRDRHAIPADIFHTRFNDYYPLLRLGRLDDALELLLGCHQVFVDAHDIPYISMTLAALADTESRLGHGDFAIQLSRDAVRYSYIAGDISGIAASYNNLGNYLAAFYHNQPTLALSSHLAAAVIRTLAGISGDDPSGAGGSTRLAANDLFVFGASAVPPSGIADLYDRLSDIPGANLPGLLTALSPDPENAEMALRDIITHAQAIAALPSVTAPGEEGS